MSFETISVIMGMLISQTLREKGRALTTDECFALMETVAGPCPFATERDERRGMVLEVARVSGWFVQLAAEGPEKDLWGPSVPETVS